LLAKKISIPKMENKCHEVSELLRTLAHPGRLMILGHLTHGEKTVSELQESTGISQSQLSQFLNRMKLEGIVGCNRKGRFCFYFVTDKQAVRLIDAVQKIFCE